MNEEMTKYQNIKGRHQDKYHILTFFTPSYCSLMYSLSIKHFIHLLTCLIPCVYLILFSIEPITFRYRLGNEEMDCLEYLISFYSVELLAILDHGLDLF